MALALIIAILALVGPARAEPDAGGIALLTPPKQAGPLVVRADLRLHDINGIDDGAETFEFSGVLTLRWSDPRQAFDPAVEGVDEKILTGNYQFDEISPGWYPQLVLVNEAGLYQSDGVVLRVRPDGSSTLIQTLNAAAKVEFSMRRFPFDEQRLEAVFAVLGFNRDEVVLEPEPTMGSIAEGVRIPQWSVTGSSSSSRDLPPAYAGSTGSASALVACVEVTRRSFYMLRLVVLPLIVIVVLSFSVFWMDRSSLGDRISVSFIGILTGVAYQMMISGAMPHIAYMTLMHGFLFFSFLTMCATVVINLVVGALDMRGARERGDLLDRRCRWIFPLAYFGLIGAATAIAFGIS